MDTHHDDRSTPQKPQGLRPSTLSDYTARMTRLQRHIAQHPEPETLTPQELAQVACMSRAHFHRVFRAMFGQSVMDYMRRLRLEYAAKQLRFHQELGILNIALDAGYQSHEAFTRAFQTHFGLTPSQYRQDPSPLAKAAATLTPTAPPSPSGVQLRRIDPINLMVVRHWGDYQEVGHSFERVVQWGQGQNHCGAEPALYGLYHDDPDITAQEHLRADVGFVPTAPNTRADGPFAPMTIPGGTYAVMTHKGPYHTLRTTYLQLIGFWLPTSGYDLCLEGVVEAYLNSPKDTDPQDLITEVRLRLLPA